MIKKLIVFTILYIKKLNLFGITHKEYALAFGKHIITIYNNLF